MTKTQVTVAQGVVVAVGVVLLIVLEPTATAAWILAAVIVTAGMVGLAVRGAESAAGIAATGLLSLAVMVGAVVAVSFAVDDGPDWQYAGYLALLLAAGLVVGWLAPRADHD